MLLIKLVRVAVLRIFFHDIVKIVVFILLFQHFHVLVARDQLLFLLEDSLLEWLILWLVNILINRLLSLLLITLDDFFVA